MATIAFCSPLPPAPTGVATYARAVLDGLEETGFTRRHDVARLWPMNARARHRVHNADIGVYQIGNNVEFHGEIYEASVMDPGVVVVHDLGLDGLLGGLGRMGNKLSEYARMEALSSTTKLAATGDPLESHSCAQVVRRARAVIVHSQFARDHLLRLGCLTPIFVAPHPLVERDADIVRAEARSTRLLAKVARGDEIVVGVAGDLNESKGIGELLRCLRSIRSNVRLVLVGRVTPYWDVRAEIRDAAVASKVTVVANASDDDFLAWLCAFDILVNLRFPHRGETSGSLVRALHVGVPTIVSGVGTYLEVPEDAVHRIPAGPPDPGELADAIDTLATDPSLRDRMRGRARAFAESELAPRATAAVYEHAIDEALALRHDPYRRAMARWAEALSGIGMDAADVDLGFGVRYAEALFEVRDGVR
ncbi:MAG: glycosyltransferase family 4 protein [Actinomycetota bacterium]